METPAPEVSEHAPEPWRPRLGPVVRRSGLIASTVITAALIAIGQREAWRLTLLGGCVVYFTVINLIAHRRTSRRPDERSSSVINLLGTQLAQSFVIIATGGLRSPVVVVIPPSCFIMSMAIESRRASQIITPYVALLVALIVLEVNGWAEWMSLETLALLGDGAYNPDERLLFGSGIILLTLLTVLNGTLMRRAYERNLAETRRSQRQALEAREQRSHDLQRIAGALAHELKNPLTAIQGLSSFMADRADPQSDEARQLEVVVGETRRMRDTLDRLLGVARPTHALVLEAVALGGLVREMMALHHPLAVERGVLLEETLEAGVMCECDPRKIKQILINLLQNAIEASPSGGRVRVTLTRDRERCLIEIEDEGEGLSLDEDPFTPGVTTKASGTGLGLAITRALAHQHHGEVSLEPRPEGGCCARLVLPAHPTLPPSP